MAWQSTTPGIVERIVQGFYADLTRELNTKMITDKLFSKYEINYDLMTNVNGESCQKQGNKLFLDHLIRNGNLESLEKLCDVLEESGASDSLPHHTKWSTALREKVNKYKEHTNPLIPRTASSEPSSVYPPNSPLLQSLFRAYPTPVVSTARAGGDLPSTWNGKDVDFLETENRRLEEELGRARGEKDVLQRKVDELLDQTDMLRKQNSSLENHLKEKNTALENQVAVLTSKIDALVQQRDSLSSDLGKVRSKLSTSKEEVVRCAKEAEKNKTNLAQAVQQKLKLENELERMKQAYTELEMRLAKDSSTSQLLNEKLKVDIELLSIKYFQRAQGLVVGEGIGKGDFGHMYKGSYNSTPVAVRKIQDIFADLVGYGSEDIQKTLREFRDACSVLMAARNPHVVKTLGIFNGQSQQDGAYLVTELMDHTLEKYLSVNRGNLSQEKQIRLSLQVALGLKGLHAQDPPLLHRSLTRRSVFLDRDGRMAKIGYSAPASFRPSGLQQLPSRHSHLAPYLPPEYLRDEDPQFDAKGDVFSLGVVMLEIATQLPPSCGLEGIGVVAEVDRRAEDLSKVPDNHPLKSLIKQCLKDNPKERPTVEEVHMGLLHPGARRLLAEVQKNEPQIFQSGVLLQGKSLRSTQLPDMPIPACHTTAVMIGERIYVSGGMCTTVGDARLVQVYHIPTGTWSTLPPSPTYESESTLIRGQLTLIGGVDATTGEATNQTWTWEEDRREWVQKLPKMPSRKKRIRPCVVHCQNYMLVAGGISAKDKKMLSCVDVFNTDTFQWLTSTSFKLPVAMWLIRAVVVSGFLCIASGAVNTQSETKAAYMVPVADVLNSLCKKQKVNWTAVRDTPNWSSGLVVNSNQPIVVGGLQSGRPASDVAVYNDVNGRWMPAGRCTTTNYQSSSFAISSSAFVVMGPRDTSSPTGNFELLYYDIV